MNCAVCEMTFSEDYFSKNQLKRHLKGFKTTCKECVEKKQTMIADIPKKPKKIKLKKEAEIIFSNNFSDIIYGEELIVRELLKCKPRETNGRILVLDLHGTADFFLNDPSLMHIQFREKYDLVVILSFVGKGTDINDPDCTRSKAATDIKKLISCGVADCGVLVFQRGPAKGWMCDLLRKIHDRDILFSDDSDDHLESVMSTVPRRNYLAGVHKSTDSDSLLKWILKNSVNWDKFKVPM